MVTQEVLQEIAEQARNNREKRQSSLIGYCYENAQETSRLLTERGIDHSVYYVGVVGDVLQLFEATRKEITRASRTQEFPETVPSNRDELYDEANHYVVGVEVGGELYAVEPCAEARDRFREAHASPWPHDQYLLLEDSKVE